VVDVAVYMDDFFGVTDTSLNHFQVDVWLTLRWTDSRNGFTASNASAIPVSVQAMNQDPTSIWMPDVVFTNQREATTILSNLLLYPNGTSIWMQRIQGKFEGNMDFSVFPWDSQTLELKMESKDLMADALILRPWLQMAGKKNEKKSMGSFVWEVQNWEVPELSCDVSVGKSEKSLCAEQGCVAACQAGFAVDPVPFVLKQRKKSSFSGAPRTSLMGNSQFKKYRVTLIMKVKRMTGNLAYLYFLPSFMLVAVAFLSFLADIGDMGTRFTISLVSLLTFEVMAERVTAKLPELEITTWSTVFHVFHISFLCGIVFENGLAAYAHLFIYKALGESIDSIAGFVFAASYSTGILFLMVRWVEVDSLLRVCIALCAAEVFVIVLWGRVEMLITDRRIMTQFVGPGALANGFCNSWGPIDAYIRATSGYSTHPVSSLLARFSKVFATVVQTTPSQELMLQRLAFERIARKAGYTDNPLESKLTHFEFAQGLNSCGLGACLLHLVEDISLSSESSGDLGDLPMRAASSMSLSMTKRISLKLGGKFVAFDAAEDVEDVVSFRANTGLLLSGGQKTLNTKSCREQRQVVHSTAGEEVSPVVQSAKDEEVSLDPKNICTL